jgi:tetratricopeptide (TPR) repeat protein
MMDRSAERIRTGDLAESPEAEVTLRLTIGEVYRLLSDFDRAEQMFAPAVDLARSLEGRGRELLGTGAFRLGLLRHDQGDWDRAGELYAEALRVLREVRPDDHDRIAEVMIWDGFLRYQAGELGAAESSFRDAIRLCEATDGSDPVLLGNACDGLGLVLQEDAARRAEAVGLHGRAQALYRGDLASARHMLATSLSSLALLKEDLGEPADQIERLHREAISTIDEVLGERSTTMSALLNNYALFLHRGGRSEEAVPIARRVLEIDRQLHAAEDHPDVALRLHNLASYLFASGQTQEAAATMREAADMRERLVAAGSANHADLAASLASLGSMLVRSDRAEEAVAPLERAAQVYRAMPAPGQGLVAVLVALGRARLATGRADLADAPLRESIALSESPDGNPRSLALARARLGASLAARGRDDEALPLMQTAAEAAINDAQTPGTSRAEILQYLIEFFDSRGQPALADLWRTHLASPESAG